MYAKITDKDGKPISDSNPLPLKIVGGVPASSISGDIQQSQVVGLVTDLEAKLTATQAAAQADSTATDVAGLVADFNTLLANLRAAGIIAT